MDDVPSPRPAGFWIRAVALALDLVVFLLVQVSFGAIAGRLLGPVIDGEGPADGLVALFTLLFTAVYTTTLHASTGQTIGKSLVDIRVVGADGGPLTVGPALLRYLAYFLSVFTFGFGFLVAGLRRDKRALHDLIAGSRVERPPLRRRVVRRAPPAPRPPGLPAGILQSPAVPRAPDSNPGP